MPVIDHPTIPLTAKIYAYIEIVLFPVTIRLC